MNLSQKSRKINRSKTKGKTADRETRANNARNGRRYENQFKSCPTKLRVGRYSSQKTLR